MTLTADDILCLKCKHARGLGEHDVVGAGLVTMVCYVFSDAVELRTRCLCFEESLRARPIEPCTGDCEHCKIRTEWRAWAE